MGGQKNCTPDVHKAAHDTGLWNDFYQSKILDGLSIAQITRENGKNNEAIYDYYLPNEKFQSHACVSSPEV